MWPVIHTHFIDLVKLESFKRMNKKSAECKELRAERADLIN